MDARIVLATHPHSESALKATFGHAFPMKNITPPALRFLLPVLLMFCLPFSLLAQEEMGKIRGFVYEKSNDLPIPYAVVEIVGTDKITTTNPDGLFIINDVPVGKYQVVVKFIGMKEQSQEVEVKKNRISNMKFLLEEENTVLQDVVVNAERQEQKKQVLTSVVTLSPKRIEKFSVGGDADLVRAIQVLPGVVTTGDQGGQLYIRGGSPIQNLVMLDNMIIYNPFHSIGFFSVFDVDILQSADVYTGGFNAEYGGRTSSVMDIRTRPGNQKRFAGKASASTYSAKLLLEGPLFKKKGADRSSVSYIISGKTSYLDQSASVFYPYVETEFGGLPFSFTDIYGKLSSTSSNGSNVSLFGFNFTDDVTIDVGNRVGWDSYGMGFDFRAIPLSSALVLKGNLAFSNYAINAVQGDGLPRSSEISGFNGGLDFTYFLRENDELRYGFMAIGYRTDFRFTNTLGRVISQTENTTELAGYFRYKLDLGNRWLIEPGVHAHYYGSLGEFSLEPRIGMKYMVNEVFRLKASGGWYSQNLVAANSDRDVVNLFYGFLSGPENIPQEYSSNRLQLARHVIVGFEYEINEHIDINVEGYIKDFNQITNINRNKLYDYDDFTKPEILRSDFIVETGLARGIDFLIKAEYGPWYLWTAYSYAMVTRDDGLQEYYPPFDRRHNLNMVSTYVFGKDKSWEVSARYNFGSGFPFTPTRGYVNNQPFTRPDGSPMVDYDYTVENGEVKVLYGDLNSQRLPNYHRFDISARKFWELSKTSKFEVTAGATNLLNRDNIFYFDRAQFKRVNQLPIMPTIGIVFSW